MSLKEKIKWGILEKSEEQLSQEEKVSSEEMLNKMSDDELCEMLQKEELADPADLRKFDIGIPILIERHYALMDSHQDLEKRLEKLRESNNDLSERIKFVSSERAEFEKNYMEQKEKMEFLNSLLADDPELEDNSVNNKIKKKFRLWWKMNYHRPPKNEHLNKAAEVAINETLNEYGKSEGGRNGRQI